MLALFGPVPDRLLDAYNQINALDHDWRQRIGAVPALPAPRGFQALPRAGLAPSWMVESPHGDDFQPHLGSRQFCATSAAIDRHHQIMAPNSSSEEPFNQ